MLWIPAVLRTTKLALYMHHNKNQQPASHLPPSPCPLQLTVLFKNNTAQVTVMFVVMLDVVFTVVLTVMFTVIFLLPHAVASASIVGQTLAPGTGPT
jgi:hypothetical protein